MPRGETVGGLGGPLERPRGSRSDMSQWGRPRDPCRASLRPLGGAVVGLGGPLEEALRGPLGPEELLGGAGGPPKAAPRAPCSLKTIKKPSENDNFEKLMEKELFLNEF